MSQVRDLHGLLHSEDRPIWGSFERIRVSSHSVNRHPDFIVFLEEYQDSLTSEKQREMEEELEKKMEQYFVKKRRELGQTGITKINLGDLKVAANGKIPGVLLNQFSLDEHKYPDNNEYLRVATTIGDGTFGTSGSVNDVYVLDNSLKIVGSIFPIFRG